ncbi:MAG: hypothetical protein HYZ53_18825 [Planctomycetes bacterium]|nr:hypothetical protein [Planctomycetota bacterium]
MSKLRWGLVALLITIAWSAGIAPRASAGEGHYGPRQYYGPWRYYAANKCSYRTYYYKPHATYSGWKHHYVMYYSHKPKYYYYYNPYKKSYWGRCGVDTDGKDLYSMLAEGDRKATLEEIPEEKFPQPSAAPAIPESSDNVTLDLPPDDLPPPTGEPEQGLPK